MGTGEAPSHRPAESYAIAQLDLAAAAPPLGEDVMGGLAALKSAIEAEWAAVRRGGDLGRQFADPPATAAAMRRIAPGLPSAADRDALMLRAQAAENGYDPEILAELFGLAEDVAVVAGHITTWPGKLRRRPANRLRLRPGHRPPRHRGEGRR